MAVAKAEATAKGPKTTTSASGKAVWVVQIGAYKTYDPAYAIAVKAVGIAPSYLADGDIDVAPLEKKNGRILYRGRVMGISKTQAYRACKFLKKKKFGCMPLKTTERLEVASLN